LVWPHRDGACPRVVDGQPHGTPTPKRGTVVRATTPTAALAVATTAPGAGSLMRGPWSRSEGRRPQRKPSSEYVP
jgi:hypothetical protein